MENENKHKNSPEAVYCLNTELSKKSFIAFILDIPNDADDNELKSNKSFNILCEIFLAIEDSLTIVVEENYVDRIYRDSYYFYYSGKHSDYNRFCRRICLFKGEWENFDSLNENDLVELFIGSVIIRPLPGQNIGRTLLNPKYFKYCSKDAYIRLADGYGIYNITVYGKRLHIPAFPFSMQDGETTSCAEITILNLADYFSQKYPDYHLLLPSDINKIAEENSFERRIPTTGLSYELISKILCEAGFYPRIYAAEKMEKSKFRRILHYYITSGIPIALGLKGSEDSRHSVIVTGYFHSDEEKDGILNKRHCILPAREKETLWFCDSADTVTRYCIMDDQKRPYCPEEILSDNIKKSREHSSREALFLVDNDSYYKSKYEIKYMLVPLSRKMYLEAADAYDISLNILANTKSFLSDDAKDTMKRNSNIDGDEIGTKDKPFVIRMFMASVRSFIRERNIQFMSSGKNSDARKLYTRTSFPRFIWVCEISTRELYKNNLVLGEIIIDATSSPDEKLNSFIFIHCPGFMHIRNHDTPANEKSEFAILNDWAPYPCFNKNLTHINT